MPPLPTNPAPAPAPNPPGAGATYAQVIDLGDYMEFETTPHALQDTLECSDPTIPTDESNLVIKVSQPRNGSGMCEGTWDAYLTAHACVEGFKLRVRFTAGPRLPGAGYEGHIYAEPAIGCYGEAAAKKQPSSTFTCNMAPEHGTHSSRICTPVPHCLHAPHTTTAPGAGAEPVPAQDAADHVL